MKKVLALLVLVTPQFLISNYENSLKGYWHGNEAEPEVRQGEVEDQKVSE